MKSSAVATLWADAISDLLAQATPPVPLHEPEFAELEQQYVRECIDSGWVSSAGKFVTEFGEALARCCEVTSAVPCVNGTAALQMCFELANVKRGDEVLIPSTTFVATANAACFAGATPHFVECEAERLAVDAAKLDAYLETIAEPVSGGARNRTTGQLIRALVVVHIFGHPADMDSLLRVARKWNLLLIEDAAEALGSRYRDRAAGSLGDLAALSFNGNKIVTSGAGGAILLQDPALAERARHLTTTAKLPHRFEFIHDEIGHNFRMPNLNAALGLAQLTKLDDFVASKRVLAAAYYDALNPLDGARVLTEPEDTFSNYWLNAIILDQADLETRDAILTLTNDRGILTRPLWRPMHCLPMFENSPAMPDLSVTESLYARVINLPSSPALQNTVTAAAGRRQ